MAALLAYMEFQFEACFQAVLQMYIAFFYYYGIRAGSTNQYISIDQSSATIIITMTNVWIPQLVGTRQHVSTLKTKVWQFCLNTSLFLSLEYALAGPDVSGVTGIYLYALVLYAGLCSTFFLHNKWCRKFKLCRLF